MGRLAVLAACLLVLAPAHTGGLARRDVPYGPFPANTLDVFVPQGEGPFPVVIYLHGGMWWSGDKALPPRWRDAYLDAGLACVSINYRLTGEARWPAQLDDAIRAVQFVRSRADEWNLDAGRVGLVGASAGAHVALMAAFQPDRADPEAADPVARESTQVAAVVDFGGPTDLAAQARGLLVEAAERGEPDEGAKAVAPIAELLGPVDDRLGQGTLLDEDFCRRLDDLSPVRHATPDAPPVLILYRGPEGVASADDPRLAWSVHSAISGFLLAAKLEQLGVTHDVRVLPPALMQPQVVVATQIAFLTRFLLPPAADAGG